jgi:hypothetical protein
VTGAFAAPTPERASAPGDAAPELIDQVLELLAQDADLRVAKAAAKIADYRKRNARGEYVWPRFRRTPKTETGF